MTEEITQHLAPHFWVWLSEQHLNRDPARAEAAAHIRDRFGFHERYDHARVMRKLAAEDSPYWRGAQALADDYSTLFNVAPMKQLQAYGAISPLVPLTLESCNHATKKGTPCGRDAVPGTGRCGFHGGQWVTEKERAAIVAEISGRLVDVSDRAVRVIVDLMDNARSEKVRLEAAIAVLDRVGVGPSTTIELNVTNDAEATAAEVFARMETLRETTGLITGEVNRDVATITRAAHSVADSGGT